MSGAVVPDGDLPPEAFAAALAGLPGMWPARLRSLLRRRSPQSAWASVTGAAPLDTGARGGH